MQIDHFDHLPEALAGLSPRDIKQVFPRPTLINLKGRLDAPVFLSTLLHGNETTSFRVLQHLQKRFANEVPNRSLMIFIGNVDAAAEGQRRLEGQPDFNRIWDKGAGRYHALVQDVLEEARRRGVFASIDVHNNTGRNPIYGCINVLRPADLQLAAMFAPVGVFYLTPSGTQSIAFSRLCPSITVECGRSDEAEGVAAAIRLVDSVIDLEAFDTAPPKDGAVSLYQTIARVLVDRDSTFSFGGTEADLVLREDLETLNFAPLEPGAPWAHADGPALPLKVLDEQDHDVTAEFLRFQDGRITLNRAVTPSMITPDQTVIRQDCLCYLMQRI